MDTGPLIFGNSAVLHSRILNEDRTIYVHGKKESAQQATLILVFDAETLFQPTVAATDFLQFGSEFPQMPPSVVVGIRNTDRNRHMPPPQYFMQAGQEDFKDFLMKELIPQLRENYRLNGHIVCVGHSQGALFATYLLAEASDMFPWIVSLDAPMQVDVKTDVLKNTIAAKLKNKKHGLRYFSGETLYGWRSDWQELHADTTNFTRMVIEKESHESMAFTGIYHGLKTVFIDFAPPTKDMTLSELRNYYDLVSKKYGAMYDIPMRVLLSTANRKIAEGRKDEIVDLLVHATNTYGTNEKITDLYSRIEKLKGPDPALSYYSNLDKPLLGQIAPYLGKWTGILIVPGGQNIPVTLEILVENDIPKLLSSVPWSPTIKEEAYVLHVTESGELIFGRKNNGGGLFISRAKIDKGQLMGKENLIGFIIPEDFPEEAKKHMGFIQTNPNTFSLQKQK